MQIDITARLVFISLLTVLLLRRKESREIKHFPQQTWTAREVMPVYWMLVLVALVTLILYRIIPERRLYQIASQGLTLFAGFALFIAARTIVMKRRLLPLTVIGFRTSDMWWFLMFIGIQYGIMITVFYEKVLQNLGLVIWFFLYISIILVFWPVIEEVFYLGMLLIPTSRIVGLITGAVLVSLLRALIHFGHDAPAVATSLTTGLLGCYLYIKTKRILAPLLLHSSLNFITLMRDLTKL